MATSVIVSGDKKVDADNDEIDMSYMRVAWDRAYDRARTIHPRKLFADFMAELEEQDSEREKRILRMESDRKAKAYAKSDVSSGSSLNRSRSLPIRRLSSRKRFYLPRRDTDISNYDNPTPNTSSSLENKHDALMSEIRQHGVLREKGIIKLKTPPKVREKHCCMPYRPKDGDLDSSEEESDLDDDWNDSGSDWVKFPDNSTATGQNQEVDTNAYEEALLRSLILFNDLDLNDEFDDEIFMNLDVLGLDESRLRNRGSPASPNYPCGPEVNEECQICFDNMKLRKRLCCDFAVCDSCMETYLSYEVEGGVVKIECINGTCDSYVHRDEILERLPIEKKEKFYRFLVDANKDPNIKTCPRCSRIYNRIENGVVQDYGKYGVKVECPECQLDWCFDCQAPWHANIKCKDFRKGDELLKSWAREHHFGYQNAQRCPKCKIFIQRNGGCDHMVCTKCNTNFCYRCGDRFLDLKFFGNHLSRLSPLGCKYNYKPNEPVKRRLVRGSLLGAKLLGGVFLAGLGLAAGAVLVGASVVILPVLGGIKFHKYRKVRKQRKQCQKLFSLRTRRAMMENLREQAVLEYVTERSRTHRQESRESAVHVGIQTGPSQQVDVTVHNPYHPDAPRDDGNLNSEITMNIQDIEGQVTQTTAKIKPGGSHDDEGDVVLHVKTTYAEPSPSGVHTDAPRDNDSLNDEILMRL